MKPKILVAGIGNELRQDDAFGMEFIRRWQDQITLPPHISTMEVGIGGIHLVQELHEAYDILIMVDAVNWDSDPGKIFFQEIEKVKDIEEMPPDEKRAFLADMHYTNPVRALMLAKALNVLPGKVYILGCQAALYDDFAIGMSKEVEQAIPLAIEKLRKWLEIEI